MKIRSDSKTSHKTEFTVPKLSASILFGNIGEKWLKRIKEKIEKYGVEFIRNGETKESEFFGNIPKSKQEGTFFIIVSHGKIRNNKHYVVLDTDLVIQQIYKNNPGCTHVYIASCHSGAVSKYLEVNAIPKNVIVYSSSNAKYKSLSHYLENRIEEMLSNISRNIRRNISQADANNLAIIDDVLSNPISNYICVKGKGYKFTRIGKINKAQFLGRLNLIKKVESTVELIQTVEQVVQKSDKEFFGKNTVKKLMGLKKGKKEYHILESKLENIFAHEYSKDGIVDFVINKAKLLAKIFPDKALEIKLILDKTINSDEKLNKLLNDAIFYYSNLNTTEVIKGILSSPDLSLRVNLEATVNGHTALSIAVKQGYKEAISCLLSYGADINSNNNGITPLANAVKTKILRTEDAILDLVKFMVKNGARINDRCLNRHSHLMDATRLGLIKVVKFFVENGADVNMQNQHGNNAIERAVKYKRHEIAEYLLTNDIKTANIINDPLPFQLACVIGDQKMVKMFLNHGAKLQLLSEEAIEKVTDIKILETLLSRAIEDENINAEQTILKYHRETVKTILRHGDRTLKEDKMGGNLLPEEELCSGNISIDGDLIYPIGRNQQTTQSFSAGLPRSPDGGNNNNPKPSLQR